MGSLVPEEGGQEVVMGREKGREGGWKDGREGGGKRNRKSEHAYAGREREREKMQREGDRRDQTV